MVPTVNWGDESTFDFCFEGIAKGSAVAVSTYMASERENRKDQKAGKGYERDTVIGYDRYLGDFLSSLSGDIEFAMKEARDMKRIHLELRNTPEENRFKTISEFKWCLYCGGEIAFSWHGKEYSVTHRDTGEIGITEAYKQETEKLCKDADEVLDVLIDGMKLREIITQAEVTERTI